MESHYPKPYFWLVLLLLAGFASSESQAQMLAYSTIQQPGNPGTRPVGNRLKDVLNELSRQYQVSILFEENIVQGMTVDADIRLAGKRFDKQLEILLKPHGLGYKRVGSTQYIIVPNPSPKADNTSLHTLPEKTGVDHFVQTGNLPLTIGGQPNAAPDMQLKSATQLEQTVSGKVTDAEKGEGLPGVSIAVKNTTRGTTTDGNGNYQLSVPNGDAVLVFSFIGYGKEEFRVGNRAVIDVALKLTDQTLNEVIVVGYGTQKKRDLTGAISSISARDIAETPASNLLTNAQGRLAGVDIVRANGNPGSSPVIRIRGNRSINASNNPLYVIDGIPTDVSISDFNPNDIESMEVLKDASAVAIYGSRGANGVILITTKKGKEGKAVISYDGYYGIKKAQKNFLSMNGTDFARYVRVSRGLTPDDDRQDATILSPIEAENLKKGISTNWLDLVLRDGIQQSHQVSASGGSKGTTFYLSGSFFDEKGVLQMSDYRRYSFRANINTNLTDRLKVGLSATFANDVQNVMSNRPYTYALNYSPLITPYNAEGRVVPYPNPREGLQPSPLLDYEPDQFADERRKYRIFATLFAEYQLAKGLTYRLNYGPDFSVFRGGTYSGTLAGGANMATVNNEQNFAYTLENIMTFDRRFNQHAVNVVGLFSTQKNRFESSRASGQNMPLENASFYNLTSAGTITGIGSSLTNWGLLSYMGRVNYSFRDRYLLTLTGRADGSSRLSPGKNWAFFPSISAGWVISDEAFLKTSPVISFLKLRAGYGAVGNTSIAPYQTLGGLTRSIYAFGNDPGYGFGLSVIPNPDLRWEVSKTLNLGLDFGLLNDRLTGSLELYDTQTSDLLLSRLIPITSGYTSILQNIGATRNRGIELTLNGSILRTNGGLRWDANLNFFANREEIVELFNGQTDDVGNQWFIGQPINVFYSFKQLGIWQTSEATQAQEAKQRPGDIKIADVNGRDAKGNLTNKPDGVINADDRTILGSTVPKWSGGITNRFSFKGIDFSFMVYARQGQMLQSDFHNLGANQWQGRNNNINLDYWTPTNPSNTIPMPYASSAPLYSDALRYFDGSFVKIRNIVLGYTLPQSLVKKVRLSSLRLYGTADNAFIFSPYRLVDPESSSGVVGGGTPMSSAVFVFGLNLKF